MQRLGMGKSIARIGFVAASLLLCSAHFQQPTKLYRAKPEDVPPWAEPGNFRFIRLDGEQIESWSRSSQGENAPNSQPGKAAQSYKTARHRSPCVPSGSNAAVPSSTLKGA